MAKPLTMSPIARSIFAVIDGLLLYLALEGVFYAIAYLGLHRSFDTPTAPYLTANLLWAVLAAILAGYTVARVARRSPVAHGLILAVPFIALGLFNLAKGLGSRRTPFVLGINILVPLAILLGSYLYSRRHPAAPVRQIR